jgi:hypothetical protein
MGDKPKEVKKMAKQENRPSWMDAEGGEGDRLRQRAAEAHAVLGAASQRATTREAPRTVPLNTLIGRPEPTGATAAHSEVGGKLTPEMEALRKKMVEQGLASE